MYRDFSDLKIKYTKSNLMVSKVMPSSRPGTSVIKSQTSSQEPEAFDYSKFHIIFLIENDRSLTPYIYLNNDQDCKDQFQIINDKVVARALLKRKLENILPENSTEQAAPRDLTGERDVEQAALIRDVIIEELQALKPELNDAASTSTVLSSLVKREQNTRSADSEIFVLISTLYNPYLPKVLIESGIPIEAVVRLVKDQVFIQQEGHTKFYESYLKPYPFWKKLKREPNVDGVCRDSTAHLTQTIENFWKEFELLKHEHSLVFRNTVFVDNALPFVSLGENPNRRMVDTYREHIQEDIRNVQAKIWSIQKAHECYENKLSVQRMRAKRKLDLDLLLEYKNFLLRRGANVPCILESVLQQVHCLRKQDQLKKHFLESETQAAKTNVQKNVMSPKEASKNDEKMDKKVEDEMLVTKNNYVFDTVTSLKKLMNWFDEYFILKKSYTGSKAIHASDEVTLNFLWNRLNRNTRDTTLKMYRTFVKGLTGKYFINRNRNVQLAKEYMSEMLKNYSVDSCKGYGHAQKNISSTKSKNTTGNVRIQEEYSSFILEDKTFYLSYYLSMILLQKLKNQSQENNRNFHTADEEDFRDLLSSALEKHLKLNKINNEKINSLKIWQSKESFSEEATRESGYSTTIRDQIIDLNKVINIIDRDHDKKSCVSPNYVESLYPDAMAQLLLSYVVACDGVSFYQLPVTGDVLLNFSKPCHSYSNWRFVVPSLLGLHDFYHFLMETSLEEDILSCFETESERSEPTLDKCASEVFILPDSIKDERNIGTVHSEELIENQNSYDSNFYEETPLKPLHFKYGSAQLIESKGSDLVHQIDNMVTLRIKKSTWSHKTFENITVTCHVKAQSDILIGEHIFRYQVRVDKVKNRLISVDFQICLNSGTRICFRKKLQVYPTFDDSVADSYPHFANFRSSIQFVESSEFNNQGVPFHLKFKSNLFPYLPMISCNNGLIIELSNETMSPFCIQQYYTGREVFPQLVRKYLLNGCVLVNEEEKDEVITMTATGETIITSKAAVETSDNSGGIACLIITPEGDVYNVQNEKRNLNESLKMKSTQMECFEDHCLLLTRKDGFSMRFCNDGALHVTYPDRTHFTTTVSVTESSENTEDGEDFILVDISVEVTHPHYYSVVYMYDLERILIHGPNVKLELTTDGCMTVQLEKNVSLSTDAEGTIWDLNYSTDEVKNNYRSVSFRLDPKHPQAKLMSLTKINVDTQGNWTPSKEIHGQLSVGAFSENMSLRESCGSLVSPFSESSFVVLSSDFSGFQILSHSVVEAILLAITSEDKSRVVQELDFVHPYYLKLLLQNVLNENDAPFNVSGKIRTKNCKDKLPSTYGADCFYPYQLRDKPPSVNNVAYRVLNRVNRRGGDVLGHFLDGLDKIEASNFEETELLAQVFTEPSISQQDGLVLAQRFRLGNLPLQRLTQNDVLCLVHEIISEICHEGTVRWKNKQLRRMIKILMNERRLAEKFERRKTNQNTREVECERKWSSCCKQVS